MKTNLFAVTFAVVALVGGMAFSAPTAEAASSYNGYIHSNGRSAVSYQNVYSVDVLQQYILQLQALLAQLQTLQNNGGYQNGGGSTGSGDVDVATKSATDISDEEATLTGEVDFNSDDEATVFFRWGSSITTLTKETTNVVLDADEDDESFEATITDLNDDTKYYFRAVAEDENGDRAYGSILSFTTDDNGDSSSSDEDQPEVDTNDADDINDDSAELNGSVDMNDFDNGHVFFVYGEDEDQVDDVANDFDTYEDVDEDGDNLQKISADSDLDNDMEYWVSMTGLDEDTEIFYAICVSYEDEDGDDVIVCGDTESFTTDEN